MGRNTVRMKSRRELETDNPFSPPAELLRRLNLGRIPAVTDEQGRRVSANSLKGMFIQQAGLCCYCGEEMTLPPANLRHGHARLTDAEIVEVNTTMVTRDHILPKSQGHPGVSFNLAAACRLCNGEKGDMPLTTFLLGRRSGNLGELRIRYHRSRKNCA